MEKIVVGHHQVHQELQRCGQEMVAGVRLSAINMLTAALSWRTSCQYQCLAVTSYMWRKHAPYHPFFV